MGDLQPLLESDLDANPLRQFERWFERAREAMEVPEAAALATATPAGTPSVRMVLLKRVDERGLLFNTNSESRKGEELAANPRAALALYWAPLRRQVRVEGAVERVSREETEAYFRTRPRGSRIGAVVSRQSRPIASYEELTAREAELERELAGAEVPLPGWWGGYRVLPEVWEFWQHRENRLHDRFRYRPAAGGWFVERLQP